MSQRRMKGDGVSWYERCPACGGGFKREVHPFRRIAYCHKCKERWVNLRIAPEEGNGRGQGFRNLDLSSYRPAGRNGPLWRYLRSRNLPDELICRLLRPHRGPYLALVYFPVYDFAGSRPVSFVGRRIVEGEPRYWYPESSRRKGSVMWGLHRFRGRPCTIVLCEGILDAVWISGGLAVLGNSVSDGQIELIRRMSPQKVVLAFDGGTEREAVEQCLRIRRRVSTEMHLARFPRGLDPGDLGLESEEFVRNAQRLV